MKWILKSFVVGLLIVAISPIYASGDHDAQMTKIPNSHAKKAEHDPDKGLIEISKAGQLAAGIKVEVLQSKPLPMYISAPGEVIPNTNKTTIVTPRIQAQVVERLVQVGDHVKKGQALVRLSSVDMAKAQATLLLANQEWKRLKSLGKKAVSAKRYQTAEIGYSQAYSRLLAYGMTRTQIKIFLQSNDPNKASGEFKLLAKRAGTIFSADFIEGQMIDPGKVLYKIVDESNLWVNAKLSNGDSDNVKKGAQAIIQTAHIKLPGTVLQVHHKLDETTRTRIVRLSVNNEKDQLHPGQFVTCLIQTGKTTPVLAVNKLALMRTADGDMAIYVEVKPNHFAAKEVQVIQKIASWRVIKGVSAGVKVVTKGAFFVHSEGLKGGFSTHNH